MRSLVPTLALLLVVAGCSSEDSTPTIPDSGDVITTSTTAPETTTTTERVDFEEATLEFTECMRDAGIDFPDVRFDAEGRPLLGDVMEEVDTESEAFTEALGECADILTDAGALDLASDPELQAVLIDQLSEFSACMRANGITDFPDPDPAFTGTGTPYPLGLIPFDAPGFEDAATVCGDDLGEFGLES